MKKNLFLIIILSFITISCELFEEDVAPREFIFKNYTNNEYNDTKIHFGQIIENNTIQIRKTEYIDISSRKENVGYFEISTGKSENWDKVINKYINDGNDIGCFIIELSDDRKIYIRILYAEDGIFSGLDIPSLFEITITEDKFTTIYNTNKLNDILVEEYSILY
ncbi:hypothetical protein [Wenyingzhuangia sp. IMCC45467]